jgi:uncharacterized membrane protein
VNRKAFDLVSVCALAAVAMTVTLMAPDSGVARVLIILPLVLFAPGYAITAAAFAARPLGGPERLLFSLGLSLAVAVLGGLSLHWTSLGLRPAAWAIVLGNTTLVVSLVALVRRWRRRADEPLPGAPRLTLAQGAQLALAALLVGGALLLAREGAVQQRATGFTQLWMLPPAEASQDIVRLGVSNRETSATRYRLLVISGGTIIGSWPSITLGPTEQWEATVTVPQTQPRAATVEATLYRLDVPDTAYRHVVYWRDSQAQRN